MFLGLLLGLALGLFVGLLGLALGLFLGLLLGVSPSAGGRFPKMLSFLYVNNEGAPLLGDQVITILVMSIIMRYNKTILDQYNYNTI